MKSGKCRKSWIDCVTSENDAELWCKDEVDQHECLLFGLLHVHTHIHIHIHALKSVPICVWLMQRRRERDKIVYVTLPFVKLLFGVYTHKSDPDDGNDDDDFHKSIQANCHAQCTHTNTNTDPCIDTLWKYMKKVDRTISKRYVRFHGAWKQPPLTSPSPSSPSSSPHLHNCSWISTWKHWKASTITAK